jgi:hypothetical protein
MSYKEQSITDRQTTVDWQDSTVRPILCEFEMEQYKNINKISLYAQNMK